MTPTIISVYANFCCLHVPLGPLSNQAPHHNIALSGAQHHFVVLFFVSRIDLDWQLGVVWNCLEYFFAMVAIRYPSIDGFAAVGCLFQPVLGYTSIFSWQRLMEVRILKFSSVAANLANPARIWLVAIPSLALLHLFFLSFSSPHLANRCYGHMSKPWGWSSIPRGNFVSHGLWGLKTNPSVSQKGNLTFTRMMKRLKFF